MDADSPLQTTSLHFCTLVARSKSAQKVLQEHKDEWVSDPLNISPALMATIEKALAQPPQWRPKERAKKAEETTKQ
eukprot:1522915-Amphidinium_carterae.1